MVLDSATRGLAEINMYSPGRRHLHARRQGIPMTKYMRKQRTVSEYQEKHYSERISLQTSDTGIICQTETTTAAIKQLKGKFENSCREQEL